MLAHSWQLSKTAASLVSRAEAEDEKSDFIKSAEYYSRYLQLVPADGQVRAKLAESYAKTAFSATQKRVAVELHYRALATAPPEKVQSLRQGLTQLLIDTGRFVEAKKEAGELLQADPESPLLNRLQALALFGLFESGSLAAADFKELQLLTKLDKAGQLNPSEPALAVALASVYREHAPLVRAESPDLDLSQRKKLADDALDRLVQDNPESANIFLVRFVYRKRFHLNGAEEDLQRALELAPDDERVLRAAGFQALNDARSFATTDDVAPRREAFQRARDLYEKLSAKKNQQPISDDQLRLGDAQLGLGDKESALATWRKGYEQFSQPTVKLTFQARMADLLLDENRLSEAKEPLETIQRILDSLGASTRAEQRLELAHIQDLRYATWHLKQGEPLNSVPLLRKFLTAQSKGDTRVELTQRAWLLLAEAYVGQGEWYESARAFDQVSALKPDEAPFYRGAANSWLFAGRADLAAERAEQALTLDARAEDWFLLATAQFRLQASQPKRDRTWDRFREAIAYLEAAKVEFQAPWRVDFLHADYCLIEGDAQDPERGTIAAMEILKAAEKKHSAAPEFLAQLSLIYEQLKQPQDADRIVDELRKLSEQSLEAAIIAAHIAAIRKDYDRATRILDGTDKSLSAKDESRVRAERVYIALSKRTAKGKPDFDAARALLLEELAKNPRSVGALRRLADLDLERMDVQALSEREKAFELLGAVGMPFSHYYRAYRFLLTTGPNQETALRAALAEQTQLVALRPRWAETHSLRGIIEQRLGHVEQAINSYEQAVQLGETRTNVYEQLISLLDSQRRTADVEKYLARLQSRMVSSQRLTELASAQELRKNEPEQALQLARDGIANRPTDPAARIWLGRLLLIRNRTDEAEQAFQEAVKLAPQDVRSWNGLFSFYINTDAKEKARETLLELADSAKLGEAERSFVLGQGCEFLAEWDEAIRHYQDAAAKLPDNAGIQLRLAAIHLRNDPVKAEACLKKARAIDPKSTLARRMLAAIWVARGTEEYLRDAEKLLSVADGDADVPVEDRRLNALLLVEYGGAEKIERAIRLLESVVKHGRGVPGDRIVLAQLYEKQARSTPDKSVSEAKLDAAKRHLLSIAARLKPELGHLAAMVEFLLRRKSSMKATDDEDRQRVGNEAGLWIDTYEETLRSIVGSPEAIARLIQLRLRHGSAVGRCETWLATLEKEDTDRFRPLSLRARVLAAGGKEAEISPLVEKQAEQMLDKVTAKEEQAKVYRGLGDVYFAVKDFSHAEAWYRRYTELEPERFEYLMAAVGMQKERLADLLAIGEAAAKADQTERPAIALASIMLENYAKPEDLRQAEPLVSAALKRFPKDARLIYSAAVMRLLEGRFNDAMQGFQRVVDLNPKHVAAINNLALLKAESASGREEAVKLIDRAIAISGSKPDLLETKGAIYIYREDHAEALKWLDQAAESAAPDPRCNFHLAVAYQKTGDLVKSREQLDKAMGLNLEGQVLTETDRQLLQDLLIALPKK